MPKHNYTHESGYDYNTCLTYKDANKLLKYHFGNDWHWKIDLEKLDMFSSEYCILGQLNGDYVKFLYGVLYKQYSVEWDLGNNHPFGCSTEINWKDKILKRRAKFPK